MPSPSERREPAQFKFQRIGAGRNRGEAVHAGGAGDGGRRAHDGRTRQGDGDAGQHAALVVGDLADELAERLASLCRRRRETERRHNRQCRKYPNERAFHR